nr:hypothetical protein CFP56_47857 [Quercus suber]
MAVNVEERVTAERCAIPTRVMGWYFEMVRGTGRFSFPQPEVRILVWQLLTETLLPVMDRYWWFRKLGPSKVISSGGDEKKGLGWRAKEEGDEVLARANNGAGEYGGLEAVPFKGEDLA